MINKTVIADWFKSLQDEICTNLEQIDGQSQFEEDEWKRPGGGGGRTRIIRNGSVIEKGGVNFSAVHGETPDQILNALKLEKSNFFASGVSIVLHPKNPWMPIIHMNIRFFEMDNGKSWFGGGIDLTPHYVIEDDAKFFHTILKETCDNHDQAFYERFKKWADDYFFIKHRNETRGIGGIFFDRLDAESDIHRKKHWNFTKEVGQQFVKIYRELASKNADKSFSQNEEEWQKIRRGRYVEFNLVYDKGTKFGLDTNGRTESILMSLPPLASWEYEYAPDINSKEAQTLNYLIKGYDWI